MLFQSALAAVPSAPAAPGDPVRPHPASRGARRAGGPVLVIRIPQFELPRPNLLDLYVARAYVRMLIMCVVGILGLFYISTFIDLSDKLFKGQVTLGTILSLPVVEDAAVPLLHHRDRGAARGHRHHRRADAQQRAHRHARVRHQHLPHGRAAARLRRWSPAACCSRSRSSILAVANRRADYLRHIIRGGSPADLRRRQSQMGGRTRGRDLPLPILRSAHARAQRPLGVPLRPDDARVDRARSTRTMPPLRRTATIAEILDGARRMAPRFHRPEHHEVFAAGRITRCRSGAERLLRDRSAGTRPYEFCAAAQVHRRPEGQRLHGARA